MMGGPASGTSGQFPENNTRHTADPVRGWLVPGIPYSGLRETVRRCSMPAGCSMPATRERVYVPHYLCCLCNISLDTGSPLQ